MIKESLFKHCCSQVNKVHRVCTDRSISLDNRNVLSQIQNQKRRGIKNFCERESSIFVAFFFSSEVCTGDDECAWSSPLCKKTALQNLDWNVLQYNWSIIVLRIDSVILKLLNNCSRENVYGSQILQSKDAMDNCHFAIWGLETSSIEMRPI
jgi:hypothetical protein